MKALILSLLVLSFAAHADESTTTRSYKKISSVEAVVTITEESNEGTQAAIYIDGIESDRFLSDLAADKNSPLAKAIAEIEMESCGEVSTSPLEYIEGCGSVEITNSVQVSYGRGGWASAGQSSIYFVGFRFDGTGNMFDSSYMIKVSESVEAQTDVNGEYNGTLLKVYSLDKVTKLPEELK
ncbi:hypothetical protein SHI21_11200 [Bacteriovorax sp. PP10]|uniref:Uncharacterized protein n=1 Tax=Bacteriovorax antarcticus TaxID=3088717 RepID=A0ABU5VVZ7_9BACT|nr:hypothetical protein [Bacteriovorax sp. PP10]MEA9356777.1 hypothetical protein [Bacteriovorax sp. PP10]